MDIRVLAIRTDFNHHGEDHGYKQILKGMNPTVVLGLNERSEETPPRRYLKYQWLYEFDARKYRDQVDLVHVMYGEDYFRWSTRLFKNKPVVVTFHQPADILEVEITKGNVRGRIGQITHMLNRNRFKQLAAAIVTSDSQKEVLAKVMDRDKIHVIPLGLYLGPLNEKFQERQKAEAEGGRQHQESASASGDGRRKIVTIGNWLRDWDFYFKLVEHCPQWDFQLVNRKLDQSYLDKYESLPNFTYFRDIDNDGVDQLILDAELQFLPVTGIAASNAITQAFGLGCPLVLTDIGQYDDKESFVSTYKPNDLDDCQEKIATIIALPDNEKANLRRQAHEYAQGFSWESITQRTIDLYKSLIK